MLNYGEFSITNTFYSTDSVSVTVVGPKSSLFAYYEGNEGDHIYHPGEKEKFTLTALATDTGTFRDTIFFYTTSSKTRDTISVPIILIVNPFSFVAHKGSIESNGIILFPNPTSAKTIVSLDIPVSSKVDINIFSPNGECVGKFHEPIQPSGQIKIPLDLNGLPAGAYYLKVKGIGFEKTTPLIISGH
jgi:hypothetical protein